MQRGSDLVNHLIEVIQDRLIREAEKTVSQLLDICLPDSVRFGLILVDVTIDFEDKPNPGATEINDIARFSDSILAPEFGTVNLAVAQHVPEPDFSRGALLTESAGNLAGQAVSPGHTRRSR